MTRYSGVSRNPAQWRAKPLLQPSFAGFSAIPASRSLSACSFRRLVVSSDAQNLDINLHSNVALTAIVFWDGEKEAETYAPSLTHTYELGAKGSLRIEAHNAESVSFASVKGVDSIDLSEF